MRDAYVSYSKTLMIFLPLLVVHPCVVSSVSSSQPCEQRVIGHSSWYVIDKLRSHLLVQKDRAICCCYCCHFIIAS